MAFLPALRPARPRPPPARLALAFASAAGLSWLGGCEEFEESRPACRRSAATSARSDSISAACSATTASSSAYSALASSAFRAASSSYDGCSGCGIPEPNHDHKADASTDTPQINRGRDWLQMNIVRRQDQEHCASITCMIRHYVARRAQVSEAHPHNAELGALPVCMLTR